MSNVHQLCLLFDVMFFAFSFFVNVKCPYQNVSFFFFSLSQCNVSKIFSITNYSILENALYIQSVISQRSRFISVQSLNLSNWV